MDRCEDCAFTYADLPVERAPGELRSLPARYADHLRATDAGGTARTRPSPETWSPLEYTCHYRDVLRFQRERLQSALAEDTPTFAPMNRDERAVAERYNEQDVEAVLAELDEATQRLAAACEALTADQWKRTGVYGWPEPTERTMEWVIRHTYHEGIHHLRDLAGPRSNT